MDGRPLCTSISGKKYAKHHTSETELSFVDSIFVLWKLRWLIVHSKNEMIVNKFLDKLNTKQEILSSLDLVLGDLLETLENVKGEFESFAELPSERETGIENRDSPLNCVSKK